MPTSIARQVRKWQVNEWQVRESEVHGCVLVELYTDGYYCKVTATEGTHQNKVVNARCGQTSVNVTITYFRDYPTLFEDKCG
jgi:hypothetical protein